MSRLGYLRRPLLLLLLLLVRPGMFGFAVVSSTMMEESAVAPPTVDEHQHEQDNDKKPLGTTTMDGQQPLNETDVFYLELVAFGELWLRLLAVYQPLEIAVLAIGLIGNLLALMTFWRSTKMVTPSFVYHRALVAADLLFCCNCFGNLIAEKWSGVECRQYVFRYWFGAFFSGILNPAITSICGYMIDYFTVLIALDRFMALISTTGFQRWNRRRVAWAVTAFVVFLSAVVHSWAPFAEGTVTPYILGESTDPLMDDPCWNETIVYFWTKRIDGSRAFETALNAKEIYNRIVRMAYPIVLSLLSLGVIVGIIRRQRRREGARRLRHGSNLSMDPLEPPPPPGHDRLRESNLSPDRSTIIRKRRRCERALFLLMVAVLLLAFVQVGASEARRLLNFIHPPYTILRTKVADNSLPLDDRLWYFRFVLYGLQAPKIFSNSCTVIERSFICILYMIMNKLFRRELFALISRYVCCGRRGRQFRSRFDSNPPHTAVMIDSYRPTTTQVLEMGTQVSPDDEVTACLRRETTVSSRM